MRYIDLRLMSAMAMAMAQTPGNTERGNLVTPLDFKGELYTVVPKGCKEYFFRHNGTFSNEQMRYADLAFKCIAINDKTAIRKFNKWQNKTEGHGALAD